MTRLRILDIDTESRLVALMGDRGKWDFLAVAWRWLDDPGSETEVSLGTRRQMLLRVLPRIERADIVTAHNVRRHDLPVLQAALMKEGMRPLDQVFVQDTYADLKKRSSGWASQRMLAKYLGVTKPKPFMDAEDWDDPSMVRARVVADVDQHAEVYRRLVELDWLNPPRTWRP